MHVGRISSIKERGHTVVRIFFEVEFSIFIKTTTCRYNEYQYVLWVSMNIGNKFKLIYLVTIIWVVWTNKLSLLTEVPACCKSSWISVRAVNGFCCTFRANHLPVFGLIFCCLPVLWLSWVEPQFFHFRIMTPIVLTGIRNSVDIFRYPNPSSCFLTIIFRTSFERFFPWVMVNNPWVTAR